MKTVQRYKRPIATLNKVLSMLCGTVWHKESKSGEHVWSIPVDPYRDFDCILSDAIAELEWRRTLMGDVDESDETWPISPPGEPDTTQGSGR